MLLAPLLLAVTLLIRLDTLGSVFFRQRCYGFNQQPFDVFKFRGMRVEAGAAFPRGRGATMSAAPASGGCCARRLSTSCCSFLT